MVDQQRCTVYVNLARAYKILALVLFTMVIFLCILGYYGVTQYSVRLTDISHEIHRHGSETCEVR